MKGKKAEVTINKEICPDSGSESHRVLAQGCREPPLSRVTPWGTRLWLWGCGAQAPAQFSSICHPDCSSPPTRI